MIEPFALADWQTLDARSKAPTFFARPAWALALARAFPALRPAPLRVRLRNGAFAIVPLMQGSGGAMRWKEYIGFPYGGYTCALNEDGSLADAASAAEAFGAIAARADRLRIVPWPLGDVPRMPDAIAVEHETAVIDLSGGAEAALAGLAGISRRMAGQAARRGVECLPDRSAAAPERYYEILAEAATRWGVEKPHIPPALLESVCRLGGDDAEIWFARHEGIDVAGGIVLYGASEMFFWSAAMRHEFSRLRPSNALNVALISAAAARGVRWYNLGSSEGLPGVARFKRDLGAATLAYREYRCEAKRFELYQSIRRTLSRRASA